MDDPTDGLERREIIAISAPGATFTPGDYPWLAAVRVFLRAGDGRPGGEDGYALLELYAKREGNGSKTHHEDTGDSTVTHELDGGQWSHSVEDGGWEREAS